MVKKGFKLHGNTGDQWSDLQGFAVADRSFKVPNPLYYIAWSSDVVAWDFYNLFVYE